MGIVDDKTWPSLNIERPGNISAARPGGEIREVDLVIQEFGFGDRGPTREIRMEIKIDDPILCEKIKNYVNQDQEIKTALHESAMDDQNDLVVTILRTEFFEPELNTEQVGRIFNAYVAWNHAVESVSIHDQ